MTGHGGGGQRLASGNQRLDAILGGGFPAHAINLVVGPPGSGPPRSRFASLEAAEGGRASAGTACRRAVPCRR
jgi:RecA/RadA recombinase